MKKEKDVEIMQALNIFYKYLPTECQVEVSTLLEKNKCDDKNPRLLFASIQQVLVKHGFL